MNSGMSLLYVRWLGMRLVPQVFRARGARVTFADGDAKTCSGHRKHVPPAQRSR